LALALKAMFLKNQGLWHFLHGLSSQQDKKRFKELENQ
jgi:hypothetical protein